MKMTEWQNKKEIERRLAITTPPPNRLLTYRAFYAVNQPRDFNFHNDAEARRWALNNPDVKRLDCRGRVVYRYVPDDDEDTRKLKAKRR